MSGIGFWELVVLFVIGLLILGPERLPRVATQVGRWVGRARRTANQLRYQIEREIALADIEKKTKNRDEKTQPGSEPESNSGPAEKPGPAEAAPPAQESSEPATDSDADSPPEASSEDRESR